MSIYTWPSHFTTDEPGTDVPDEEWSPNFRNPVTQGVGVIGSAGMAEIKPHHAKGIRQGLKQLRDYLSESQQTRTARPARAQVFGQGIPPGSEPARRSVWLITYLPEPENTKSPQRLRLYAHRLNPRLLMQWPMPGLDSMTLYRRELGVLSLTGRGFPTLNEPDRFGRAVEGPIRQRFIATFKRPGDPRYRQAQGSHGPDILWRELAGLFQELANVTGDTYWREVAEELSQHP